MSPRLVCHRLQDEVFVRCHKINRAGVSIVMAEQNASRRLQICHRGYVLDQGTNAYTGTGRDLHRPEGDRVVPRHFGEVTPRLIPKCLTVFVARLRLRMRPFS